MNLIVGVVVVIITEENISKFVDLSIDLISIFNAMYLILKLQHLPKSLHKTIHYIFFCFLVNKLRAQF